MNNPLRDKLFKYYSMNIDRMLPWLAGRELVLQGFFLRSNGAMEWSTQPHRFHFHDYRGAPGTLLTKFFTNRFVLLCVNASLQRVDTKKLTRLAELNSYEDARAEFRENTESYLVKDGYSVTFDFDHEIMSKAWADCLAVKHEIDTQHPGWGTQITFSGKKGYHLHTGHETTREKAKKLQEFYKEIAPSLDLGMSDPLRYVKIPLTIHPSTGNQLKTLTPGDTNHTKRIIEVKNMTNEKKKSEFGERYTEVMAVWDIKKSRNGNEYIDFTEVKEDIPKGSRLIGFTNKLYRERNGNTDHDQSKLPPRFRVFIDTEAE